MNRHKPTENSFSRCNWLHRLRSSESKTPNYNYSSTEQTDYNLYYFESPSGINGSGIYNTKLKRHFAALSLSFRF